jgi:hypothetical protein
MEETGEAFPTKLVYAYYMSNNQCDIIISKLPEGAYQTEGEYPHGGSISMYLPNLESASSVIVTSLKNGADKVTLQLKIDASDEVLALAESRENLVEAYEKYVQDLEKVHDIYSDASDMTPKQIANLLGFKSATGYKNNTPERFQSFIGDASSDLGENAYPILGVWEKDEDGYLRSEHVQDSGMEASVASFWSRTGGLLAIPAEDPDEEDVDDSSAEDAYITDSAYEDDSEESHEDDAEDALQYGE